MEKDFFKNFGDPVILEGHDGENPLEDEKLKEALDKVAEMILEDVKNLGKHHDDDYKKGGFTGPNLHKIEVRGIAKDPKPWYKIFSKD